MNDQTAKIGWFFCRGTLFPLQQSHIMIWESDQKTSKEAKQKRDPINRVETAKGQCAIKNIII